MVSQEALLGRPYGGTLIIWHNNCRNKITPICLISFRVTAVTVTFPNDVTLLAINVYMPCDDRRKHEKYHILQEVLNDIQTLICDIKHDCVIIAGDLNCDFGRNSPHVTAINEFMQAADMKNCLDHILANIPFTFESKGTGTRSTIDHVLVNADLFGTVHSYEIFDSPCNMSDHCPVLCTLDMEIAYFGISERIFTPRPSWNKATAIDVQRYRDELDHLLSAIPLPHDALMCRDPHCELHSTDIDEMNASIIQACLAACDNAIPMTKKPNRKQNVPGWKEFVKDKKQLAYSWHKICRVWQSSTGRHCRNA